MVSAEWHTERRSRKRPSGRVARKKKNLRHKDWDVGAGWLAGSDFRWRGSSGNPLSDESVNVIYRHIILCMPKAIMQDGFSPLKRLAEPNIKYGEL